jgi:hypothetical protein
MTDTFDEFIATYATPVDRPIIEVDARRSNDDDPQPFIIVRGPNGRTILIDPLLGDENHLCVDAHAFIDGQRAAIGAMGMSREFPARLSFPEKPGRPTSHGWPAAHTIALLLGAQGVTE